MNTTDPAPDTFGILLCLDPVTPGRVFCWCAVCATRGGGGPAAITSESSSLGKMLQAVTDHLISPAHRAAAAVTP